MPGVPMRMPSETVMVPKITALRALRRRRPAAASARQLVDVHVARRHLLQVEAMPTCGLAKSAR